MTIKEMEKYGYFFRNRNLLCQRIFVATSEEDIQHLESSLGSVHQLLVPNVPLSELSEQLNLFFQMFKDVKIGCIAYFARTEKLYFLNLSRAIEKQEFERYFELKNKVHDLPINYTICLRDLMKEVISLSKIEDGLVKNLQYFAKLVNGVEFQTETGKFLFPTSGKDDEEEVISVFYKQGYQVKESSDFIEELLKNNGEEALKYLTQLEKIEMAIYSDKKINLAPETSLSLAGKESQLSIYGQVLPFSDGLGLNRILPKNKKLMKELGNYELNIKLLPEALQEYLINKDKTKIEHNQKELLFKNPSVE